MNSKRGHESLSPAVPGEEDGLRSRVKLVALGILGLCVVVFAWRPWQPSVPQADANATALSSDSNLVAQRQTFTPWPKPSEPTSPVAVSDSAVPTAETTAPPLAKVSAATAAVPVDPALGTLVTSLRQLSGTNVVLTPELVAIWRANFQQLVQGGVAAVTALQALLQEKMDFPFSPEVQQMVGYSSARLAAIDALRQIGGPESTAVMEKLLGETTVPKEIAVLARNLEAASPGQYREQSLSMARVALTAVGTAKDPQLDVAPLFEVYQHFGNVSVVPELEKATSQWKYYATMTLANLPDGAGIPALLKMADPITKSGNRLLALETVAQMAPDNAVLREFLVSQATGKRIPANYWPYLIGPLTGDQYFPVDSVITKYPTLQSLSDLKTTRIPYGNQNLYSLPADLSLTPEAIQQRVALVEELLQSASDPAALQALQHARNTLMKRATRPPPPPTGN